MEAENLTICYLQSRDMEKVMASFISKFQELIGEGTTFISPRVRKPNTTSFHV